MVLNDYLKEEKLSISKFSRRLGLCEATVNAWKHKGTIPTKELMIKVYKETNGKVTPNDFYGINQ